MSYRIHLNIVKTTELIAYLTATEDEYFDLDYGSRDVELHDNLDISRFTPISKFKDDEYCPYTLSKQDFQYILDYYKKLNRDNYAEKESDETKGDSLFYFRIKEYFNSLIKNKENISSSGLFLLDYFYLVKMYDNLKDDETVVITHG